MSDNRNEFDLDPEYLMRQLKGKKKNETGLEKKDSVILTAPPPVQYDPDDDEISAEEFARIKKRYAAPEKKEPVKRPVRDTETRKPAEVRKTSEGTVKRSAEGTARRTSEGTVRRSAEGTVRKTSDGTVRRSPEGTARRTSEGTVRKTPDGTVRRTPEGTARRTSERPVRNNSGSRHDNNEMAKRFRNRDAIYKEMERREKNAVKEKKKISLFWILLAAWAGFLLILGIIAVIYTGSSLKKYEASQPENNIRRLVGEFADMVDDGTIVDKVELPAGAGEFESADIFKEVYLKQFEGVTKITYLKNENSHGSSRQIYDIYAEDNLVAYLTIEGTVKEKRLKGILAIAEWKIGKIEPVLSVETHNYTISAPSDYKVTVNGHELGKDNIIKTVNKSNKDLELIKEYVQIPTGATNIYRIQNLVNAPDIKIKDASGADVSYTPDSKGNIVVEGSGAVATEPELTDEVKNRSLEMIQTWQRFLLAEYISEANRGLARVKPYVILGSAYDKQAEEYSKNVDITFISDHTVGNPEFSDVVTDEYKVYADNCYSLHISYKKNMHLTRTGENTTDDIDMTIYFVYYDDTDDGTDNPHWAMAYMKSNLKEDKNQTTTGDNTAA